MSDLLSNHKPNNDDIQPPDLSPGPSQNAGDSPALEIFNHTTSNDIISSDISSDPDDEMLTALLDGELSDEETISAEQRLAADPDLAARYARLCAAAKFLDTLEPVTPGNHFSASTMEMLTVLVRNEVSAAQMQRRRHLFIMIPVLFAAGISLFLLGGFLVAHFLPQNIDPREELRAWVTETKQTDPPPAPVESFDERGSRRRFNDRFSTGSPPTESLERRDRGRIHEMRRTLPEELRTEHLRPSQGEMFRFLAEKYPEGFGTKPREELLREFIEAQGVEWFTEKLSPAAKEYFSQLAENQKIREIGLLMVIDFQENRTADGLPPGENPPRNRAGRPATPPNWPPRGDPSNGLYWKTESTKELAATLSKLPPETRERLLNLPDEEMYSQLLILHWGFDPKQIPPPGTGSGPIFPVPH